MASIFVIGFLQHAFEICLERAAGQRRQLSPSPVGGNTSMALLPSVAISTSSTLHPCSEMRRLTRCSRPKASSATISSTV
jgi:hypothetical protein